MKFGTGTVSALKLGTADVSKVYLGASLVWEAGGAPYSPAVLFAASEPGFWATVETSRLWQDTARTTPVTTAGDPVGSWELTTASGVAYAEQATASRRPTYQLDGSLPYLSFDGVDDWLRVTTIDLSGTDKLTAIWGFEKRNDTSNGFYGYSTSVDPLGSGTGNAAILPNRVGAGFINIAARQTVQSARRTGNVGTIYRAVITHQVDFAQTSNVDANKMRLDKVDQTLTAAGGGDMGSGNFGNHPLTIGAYPSGANNFNGRCYGVVFRGALTSGTDLTDAEDWVNGLTGAY